MAGAAKRSSDKVLTAEGMVAIGRAQLPVSKNSHRHSPGHDEISIPRAAFGAAQ